MAGKGLYLRITIIFGRSYLPSGPQCYIWYIRCFPSIQFDLFLNDQLA